MTSKLLPKDILDSLLGIAKTDIKKAVAYLVASVETALCVSNPDLVSKEPRDAYLISVAILFEEMIKLNDENKKLTSEMAQKFGLHKNGEI